MTFFNLNQNVQPKVFIFFNKKNDQNYQKLIFLDRKDPVPEVQGVTRR